LAAAEEAVAVYRRLAQADPAAYEPHLAMSLNNLGLRLSEAGRGEEALAATEKAVAVYRRVAQVNPAAYEPNLAASLHNLSIMLSQAGQWEEALTTTREGVTLYRRLAMRIPRVFTGDLQDSLTNTVDVLNGLGRQDDALALWHLVEVGALDEAARLLQETALREVNSAGYLDCERPGDIDEQGAALLLAACSIGARRPGGRRSPPVDPHHRRRDRLHPRRRDHRPRTPPRSPALPGCMSAPGPSGVDRWPYGPNMMKNRGQTG
jgi:tetratricopeptide (TPR) repeat protein